MRIIKKILIVILLIGILNIIFCLNMLEVKATDDFQKQASGFIKMGERTIRNF